MCKVIEDMRKQERAEAHAEIRAQVARRMLAAGKYSQEEIEETTGLSFPDVRLLPCDGQADDALALIKGFWQAHNHYTPSDAEALDDLAQWTAPGHSLYLLSCQGQTVGFVHLGSRGCEMDWLEDIFVLPAWQNKGIGSCAIRQVEAMVKAYSGTLYIEVAATNPAALQLYHDLGYTCLNTVTVRKDFAPERQRTLSTQTLFDRDFAVRVPSSDESE